jgi:hypothetical protein
LKTESVILPCGYRRDTEKVVYWVRTWGGRRKMTRKSSAYEGLFGQFFRRSGGMLKNEEREEGGPSEGWLWGGWSNTWASQWPTR